MYPSNARPWTRGRTCGTRHIDVAHRQYFVIRCGEHNASPVAGGGSALMAKRTRFAEYKDRYRNCKFELSEEGILLMQCHTNGDSLVWDWEAHDGMSDAFADIAGDREIKVLIHTGTGENYNANWSGPGHASEHKPVYLAMDGPGRPPQPRREGLVRPHAHRERARGRRADDQRRQRPVQHSRRSAPAGRHRARLGGCLLPRSRPLSAWDGARRRRARPLAIARRTQPRPVPVAQRQFFPFGGGMRALDRPWDQQPWSD